MGICGWILALVAFYSEYHGDIFRPRIFFKNTFSLIENASIWKCLLSGNEAIFGHAG